MIARHAIHLGVTRAPRVELARSLVTGRARLYVDGVEWPPTHGSRCYRISVERGATVELEVSPPRWDGAECVRLDGREVWIALPLHWHEAITALAPLVMILGGAISALIGAGALAINLTIIRSRAALWVRLLGCAGVVGVAAGAAIALGALVVGCAALGGRVAPVWFATDGMAEDRCSGAARVNRSAPELACDSSARWRARA